MVTEGDVTLGGGHTMQYTGDVSQNCTRETSIIVLINATPVNVIKCKKEFKVKLMYRKY